MKGEGRVRAHGLMHPWFIVALSILLINDHLLKGAGVLPAWLTGKLSDFAGLVVAPVLTTALVPKRRPWLRAVFFMLPVVVFAILNLSPEAAARFDAWGSLTGLSWRTVSDKTDLVAFVVLPVPIWLAGRGGRPALALGPRLARRAELALAMLAALACAATTVEHEPSAYAMIENATQATVRVRVRPLEGKFDCDSLLRNFRRIKNDRFGAPLDYELDPLGAISLDHYGLAGTGECGAALVDVAPLPLVEVVWGDLPLFIQSDRRHHRDQVLRIEGIGSAVDFSGGSALDVSDPADMGSPVACDVSGRVVLSWSTGSFFSPEAHTLSEVSNSAGCLNLTFDDATALELCIPDTSFPFVAGDELLVDVGQRLTLTDVASTTRLTLQHDALPGGFAFEADDCDPEPSVCGGLIQPGHLVAANGAVSPGETLAIRTGASDDATLLLGRADRVVLTDGDCPDARSELDLVLDLLITEHLP